MDDPARSANIWADIQLHSTWGALAPLTGEPLVSIVLPTRSRSGLLTRAIESALRQTYRNFELIVVDDGSDDDTARVVDAIADERVRLIEGAGSGAAHARNLGLRQVSGTLVTFLDDDNLMIPGWLRAVVVAFQDRPALNAVYGAQVRASEPPEQAVPSLLFVNPFDWDRLVHIGNYIDLGVVAHRSGLANLWFDESLPRLIDYEYVVRLAGRFDIQPLPVVASLYTTDAPERITTRQLDERFVVELQRRFQRLDAQPSLRPSSRRVGQTKRG